MHLPKVMPLVEGVGARIIFDHARRSVLFSSDWHTSIKGENKNGANFGDAWYWASPTVGTETMKIGKRLSGGSLDNKDYIEVTLDVMPRSVLDRTGRITAFGDSISTGGENFAALNKLMPNLQFEGAFNGGGYNYNAANGCDWAELAFQPNLNKDLPNPAYNPATKKFDYALLLELLGQEPHDVALFNLGTNDAPHADTDARLKERITALQEASEAIIESIQSVGDTKVVISTIHPPANQIGAARSFGNGRTSPQHWRAVRELNAELIEHWDGEPGVTVSLAGHMIHDDHFLNEKAKTSEVAHGVTIEDHGNLVHYDLVGSDAWALGIAPAIAASLPEVTT